MRFVSVAITLCLLVVSCGQKPEDIAKVEPKNIRESAFTIAILPEQNVFEQKKRYKPLAEYLSKNLNMNVKIKLLDSYGSIYDEIKNKTIDGAFFGSFNYVLTKARADIEPVARALGTGGNSNYKGIIFTRKDTGLTADVKTWKDKRIALVHEVTTAGYVFPAWHLKKNGVASIYNYFGKIIFSGSHDAAILSVFKGQADIGAAKDLILQKLLSENPAIKNDIVILAGSVAVPSNSLCLRRGVDGKIRESLKKSLLSMHHNADGKTALQALDASKFVETADSEFNVLRQMAKDIGLDIKLYPFRGNR